MCGINGFTFFNQPKIRQMNQCIRHRGPDDEGIYGDENISLGNVRLAIQDLSYRGHMPMEDSSGRFVITFNGEIYNFKELRQELVKKYRFVSGTDTEVILYLYREYGEKALQRLNGIFALAIWDKREKVLLLARDRAGVKPLYYTVSAKNQLIFSSEIKAFLVHNLKKEVDTDSLNLYMRLLYVPGEKTMIKGVFKLPPRHCLKLKGGKLEIRRYWQVKVDSIKIGQQEIKAKIKDYLTVSIKKQLVADRPVGIFLSGGIDSTAILGLATEMQKSPLETFSAGFDIEAEADKYNADFYLARNSAEYFGSHHHELVISPKEALRNFEAAVGALDQPLANPNQIPIYLLAKFAREKVVVVLGGDGGDELFGGYDRYLQGQLLSFYQLLPRWLRRNLLDVGLQKFFGKEIEFLKRLDKEKPVERYFVFMAENERQIRKLTKEKLELDNLESLFEKDNYSMPKGVSFYDQFSYLDFKNWLPEESLLKTDNLTMAHGLEQRVPFLDNHLIDLAFRIPWYYKLGLSRQKQILRQTFVHFLPKEILAAPKRGFFTPAAKWLRDKRWQDFVMEVLSKSELKKTSLFETKAVCKTLEDHIQKKNYNLNLIWAVLTFQLWYRKVYEA